MSGAEQRLPFNPVHTWKESMNGFCDCLLTVVCLEELVARRLERAENGHLLMMKKDEEETCRAKADNLIHIYHQTMSDAIDATCYFA